MTTNHDRSGSTPDGGAKHDWIAIGIWRYECDVCGASWKWFEEAEPFGCSKHRVPVAET